MSPPPPPGGRTGLHSSAVAAITSALHTTVPGPAGGGGMPRPAKTSRDHRVPHVSLTLQYREEGTVASQRGLRLRRLHQFAAALPGAFGNRPAAAVYGTSSMGQRGTPPAPTAHRPCARVDTALGCRNWAKCCWKVAGGSAGSGFTFKGPFHGKLPKECLLVEGKPMGQQKST